jgi:hypothetical protein
LRVSAFGTLFFGAVLFIIEEATAPALYLVAFVLFQFAMLVLIGIGIADWRLTKRHRIIDHGETELADSIVDKVGS